MPAPEKDEMLKIPAGIVALVKRLVRHSQARRYARFEHEMKDGRSVGRLRVDATELADKDPDEDLAGSGSCALPG